MKTETREKQIILGRSQTRLITILTLLSLIFSIYVPSLIVRPNAAYAAGIETNPYQGVVSAGGLHSLHVDSGKVWAWGDNTYGQLGDGTNIQRSDQVLVQGLNDLATSVAAGGSHSLALLKNGSVAAWGKNDYGQLGDGATTNRNTAVTVQGLTDVISVAAGDNHSLALKDDGTVWAWGNNSSGQLGDGSQREYTTPHQVKGLNQVISIAAGGDTSMALTSDGKAWAWGNNQYGQLGDGTTNNQTIPVLVQSLTNIMAISAGWTHSLALKNDGSVWAWGDNSQGTLGTGSTADYSSAPTQVKGLSNITAISAGNQFSLADTNQDGLWAWGCNDFNQLGDGSVARAESSPVKVKNITDEPLSQSISAGGYHAIYGTLNLKAWGSNAFGQLGLGISEQVTTPENTLFGTDPVYFRKAGQDRSDTAAQIAETGWSYGAKAAVLVNEDSYADALPGTVLAAAVNAPILLTNTNTLAVETADELQRLKPETIFILGGNGVVSSQIEQKLKDNYQNVIRISGSNRYQTSEKIAEYLKDNNLATHGKAVLAYGENFPDALTVSSLAAYQHIPILLTQTDSIPSNTQEALTELQVSHTIVVGGTGVISSNVASQLPGMERFWGMDRYDTAIAIAKGMNADLNTEFIATGENFPDALAGSVLAARTNSPIILVNKELPSMAGNFINSNKSQIEMTMVLGGTGVVSDNVLEAIINNLYPNHPFSYTSLPSSPPITSPTIPQQVPNLTKPQILAPSDLNQKGLTENVIWFKTLRDGDVYPKKDLTINWTPVQVPNFLIEVQDVSINPISRTVFWAYVGDVNSYTLPGSIFTEGDSYRIRVAATTGTDRNAPGYKEWYAQGGFYPESGVLITIHTLKPVPFIFPTNGANVPKGDVTVKWLDFDWKDLYGGHLVRYTVRLYDLTNITNPYTNYDPTNYLKWDSCLIPGSVLASGHTYRFEVDELIPGYVPENHQVSNITFTIR